MPRGDLHDLIERVLLGKITAMSDVMDMMHPILHSHHRIFGHDPVQVAILAALVASDKDSFWDNFKAGIVHLLVDKLFDGVKNAGHHEHNPPKRRK